MFTALPIVRLISYIRLTKLGEWALNKKQVLRTAIFLALVLAVLVLLSDLFKYKNTYMSEAYADYKNQRSGTVDAVYLGSSAVNRYWIAAKAYDDYGMTVYPLSTDSQPPWLTLTMLQEAMASQNPKLVIIDIRSFAMTKQNTLGRIERSSRYLIDELPFFSPRRWKAIDRSLEIMHRLDPENYPRIDISYAFPFIRFHSKWDNEDFTFDELAQQPSDILGFYLTKRNSVSHKKIELRSTEKEDVLEPWSEEYLRELLQYLKDHNIDALFVNSPHEADDLSLARYNTMQRIIEGEGFPYLSYVSKEKIAEGIFDEKTDFYNKGHVNYEGAVKFTGDLAAYLDQNYDLPDHRQDPKCSSWNGVFRKIQKKIKKLK